MIAELRDGPRIGHRLGAWGTLSDGRIRRQLRFLIVIVALAGCLSGPSNAAHDMSGDRKRGSGLERRLATTLQLGT
jgi:hypothetical protein